MFTRPLAAIALGLIATTVGCSSTATPEVVERPVRFAVVGSPEVGQDDGDLLGAVTKLSREKQLDFVLVLGPLFAADADATSLECLKNDLGQIAAPVYVSFSAAAPVTSAAPSKLGSEEILAAVEGFGPGAGHKLAYLARPERAKTIAVNALAPDGSGAVERPADARRLVRFGVAPSDAKGPSPDVVVALAPGIELQLEGARAGQGGPSTAPVAIRVPPLARKLFAIVTLSEETVALTPVALEGTPPAGPPSVAMPTIDRKPAR